MASTSDFTLASDAWTEIASGVGSYLIRTNASDGALLHAAQVAPAQADVAGFFLDKNATVSLIAGEKLFARGFAAAPTTITVLKMAPASAGGGGSSETTEATQLLVLAELQAIDAKVPAPVSGASPVIARNISNKFREAFEAYDPVAGGRWAQTLASGDIIALDGNAAAESYLVISKDPLSAGTESRIQTVATWGMPFEAAVGLHTSQRTLGQEFSVEVVSNVAPLAAPADLQIASIQQSGSTLTVTTAAAHGLRPGMRFGIRNCADSRLNYPAVIIATTPSPTQFTATAGPAGNLPSVTAGPFSSGFVFFRSAMGLAPNGTSMVLENATATNASFYVRSESGDSLPSGTILGNHSATISSTASVQAINAALTYAFQPQSEFRLTQFIDGVQWSDSAIDTLNASASRYKRTQVVPDPAAEYRLRFRATNAPSLTRPVAQIVSVTKTGSSTATVVTDAPHGLTTSDVLVGYGVRDQTNFANLTAATAIASVVDSTTLTVVWGGSTTATSYGGYIARVNGGNLMSALGAVAQVAQSISRTGNIVTLVGNAAWSGLQIGDYANLVGIRDNATGASLGLDGPYRVRDVATTNLILEPIGTTPTGTDVASVNCGGAVIKRTDLRISFVRAFNFERQRVEMMPRPTGDISSAVSVNLQSALPAGGNTIGAVNLAAGQTLATLTALTGGGAAEDAAAGANPVVGGGVVRTARAPQTLVAGDAARFTMTTEGSMTIQPGPAVPLIEVASAARNASGNSGAISNATGGAISGLIVVSAASGTTPTLDVGLEESYDNGTTWTQVWAAQRFTGTATAVIPPMLVGGLRRWTWTVGGSSPSFTFAITVNTLSGPAPILRQSFDRTAGLLSGTLNATSAAVPIAGCTTLTAKVSIGAATTPATYQLRISDDGASWSTVGTATAAVANGTVAFAMPVGLSANFAQVICTVAGSGQTGNYVAINATY